MKAETVREVALPYGLEPSLWHGSFNGRECSLQQLAPYVGKLKSGMVQAILGEYSDPGDVVLDPFAGAGVVPLEALLMGRKGFANDLSEYAYALTTGKLAAPSSVVRALQEADAVLSRADALLPQVDAASVPGWVAVFFHPDTLRETLAAFRVCDALEVPFIRACLLGILHHVRPGFLSYPASHLTPYLRPKKYPPDEFPGMYAYRDVASRLRAKVRRAYRRPPLASWTAGDYRVTKCNTMDLPYEDASVDVIVSSPPYFGALDYARDNRLRLWFLGVENWRDLDKRLTANEQVYLPQMRGCLVEMHRVLKAGRHCVLVLGDYTRDGKTRLTAELIAEEAQALHGGAFTLERLVADEIPDDRRSRRRTRTTLVEKIVVLRKRE